MSRIEGFDGSMGKDGVWRFSDEKELSIQHDDRELRLELPTENGSVIVREEL